MHMLTRSLIMLGFLFLAGCGSPGTSNGNDAAGVMPTPRPPMTLAPTYTPAATPGPLPTITPPPARETAVSNTPIPFDETILELHYRIPLLGLDRRLQANVANQIIVVDETTGRSIQRNNEGSVMFELRQALSNMELAPMPEECPGCVFVEYELSDANLSGSGWLKDPVLLASIENFTSATLGPHLPENTIIGLRRSASPFAPGHTIAVTENGRLWSWLATEAEVSPAGEANPQLFAELSTIDLASLNEQYQADCRGVPIETLILAQGSDTWTGRIVCPELTLPTTLQPLYLQLDNALADKLGPVSVDKPKSAFPVNGLLQYTSADTSQLTLFPDSTLVAIDALGTIYTTTLTSTLPISLTTSLLETGVLQSGYTTFTAQNTEPVTTTVTAEIPMSTLAVRGPDGVYDAEWRNLPDYEAFQFLHSLLTSFFSSEDPSASETPVETTEEAPTASPMP
jgi:hypothetical protein